MVELIVTFALLAILGAAVIYVIGASMNTFSRVSEQADAQHVSNIIMEKVSGEISGAQGGVKSEYTLSIMDSANTPAGEEDEYYTSSDFADRTCIAFTNRSGSPMYITTYTAESGQRELLVHYRPVNDSNIKLKAVDWTFDKAVYKGYEISSLNFEIIYTAEGVRTNIIKIDMTLRNSRSGHTYSTEEYVECYNFTGTEITKIEYKAIKKDIEMP